MGEKQERGFMSINDSFVKDGGDYIVVSPIKFNVVEILNILRSIDCKRVRFVSFEFVNCEVLDNDLSCFSDLIKTLNSLPVMTVSYVDGVVKDALVGFILLSDLLFVGSNTLIKLSVDCKLPLDFLYYLLRYLGFARTKELLLFGELPSDKLVNGNFVNGAFTGINEFKEYFSEVLLPALREVSPRSVMLTKKAIDIGCNLPFDLGLLVERELFSYVFTLQDRIEGLKAFIDKRKPDYKGGVCHDV